MKKMVIHLELAHGVSECGYFTPNTTKDRKEVTCKHCQKIISKQWSER